jgi:chromosome segregation ATPase
VVEARTPVPDSAASLRRRRAISLELRHAARNAACYREEAAMAGDDITIEILKEIRAELRGVNQRMDGMDKRFDGIDERFDGMNQRFDTLEERIDLTSQRLDITNERLGVVESTLLTLARRQRTAIKYLKATADHGSRLDTRVTDLEVRVGRLENR